MRIRSFIFFELHSYELLAWQHYENHARLLQLTEWLVAHDVCNVCDLRDWLSCESRTDAD